LPGGKYKRMNLDWLLKRRGWHVAAFVFLVCLTLRLMLDLIFQSHFGWHAVNHVETWFYTGVMEGTHLPANGIWDPTVWVLRGVGVLIPAGVENALYGVLLTSAALSSLTAALIYLLVAELYERKTGFTAGLVYGGMVEPLALCVSGFTHDHMQLPVMVATMLLAVKAVKSDGSRRLAWALSFAAVAFVALFINEVILVGVGVSGVYVSYEVLRRLPIKKWGRVKFDVAYALVIASLIVGLLIIRFVPAAGGILVAKLESLPQGRLGSADVMPLNLLTLWLRYNILLFLMPYAIIAALRRRDTLGLGLTACGLVIAAFMDRGTRISDMGAAILFSYAVADWNVKLKNTPFFGLKSRFNSTAAFSALVFVFMLAKTTTKIEYLAVFSVGAASMLYLLRWVRKDSMVAGVVATIILMGAAANTAYTYTVEPRKIVSDTEYQVVRWLADNNRGGSILAGWDRGYMLEAVSGLKAVSTPNAIDKRVHHFLWQLDRQAAVNLRKEGVGYVLLNSENFNVARLGGELAYRLSGGLLMTPDDMPPMELTNRLVIYKLRHRVDEQYFRLLRDERDPVTGLEIVLWEVTAEPVGLEWNKSLVGAVAVNVGDAKTARISINISGGDRVFRRATMESFGPNEVKEVLYTASRNLRAFNCSLAARPAKGEMWGYVGILTYLNTQGARDVDVTALLIDAQTGESAAIFNRTVKFKEGQKRSVRYSFENADQYREYILGLGVVDGLKLVEDESTQPTLEGVRFLAVYC
jgi:hypothetical protein